MKKWDPNARYMSSKIFSCLRGGPTHTAVINRPFVHCTPWPREGGALFLFLQRRLIMDNRSFLLLSKVAHLFFPIFSTSGGEGGGRGGIRL